MPYANISSFLNQAVDPAREAELRTQMRDRAIQLQLKDMRYNELVGCIEVHSVFTQLRADLWFTDKKRVVVGSETKCIIRWCGKMLEREYGLGSPLTSREIFENFRRDLKREVERHRRLRRRHIDFAAFDRCGPFVDWHAVLQLKAVTK